jgi:DTW domain-containing protein YfiP
MLSRGVEATEHCEISSQNGLATGSFCSSNKITKRISIAHYFILLAYLTSIKSTFVVAFSTTVLQRQNRGVLVSSPARRQGATVLSAASNLPPETEFESSHLDELEQAVKNVLQKASIQEALEEEKVVPVQDREAIGVAKHLQSRIDYLRRTNSCRRCWLHREEHCVCIQCPPLETLPTSVSKNDTNANKCPPRLGKVKRIFLLQHHKEIGMVVDTAKFITAAFPESCQLVVNGIGPDYQPSMRDMLDSIDAGRDPTNRRCLVLFPAEGSKTSDELFQMKEADEGEVILKSASSESTDNEEHYDLIVIDGTWSQARKMHARYMPPMENGGPQRVCLSKEALAILGGTQGDTDGDDDGQGTISGHQLRRHSIEWKKVSTFEATRLFLRDIDSNGEHKEQWDALARYQQIGDNAAMRQLGPPRYPLIR